MDLHVLNEKNKIALFVHTQLPLKNDFDEFA